MTSDFLKKVPLFADLSAEDLVALSKNAKEVRLSRGETLFAEGSPGQNAYVICEGELEILKEAQGRNVLLAVRKPGEMIGEMALLEEAPRMASVKARSDSLLLAIDKESLDELLKTSHAALNSMFHSVLSRLRDTQTMLRQSEKMAQLGLLTAGVAHELNNPAAAVKRGERQLSTAFSQLMDSLSRVATLGLNGQQEESFNALRSRAMQPGNGAQPLDALARSDLREDIEAWYRDRLNTDAPNEVVGGLVDLGISKDEFEALAESFTAEQLPDILSAVAYTYSVNSLLAEVGEGAKRVSEIVGALKSYAYLDQAPVQEVDVHRGIEDTLILFNHKLKEGINVRREFAKDLPRIQAYGSELNQVWTNLIDNAIQAMNGRGELVIRSRREGDWIVVEVEDSGPGIPEEHQPKVFDAFFTTKPPGSGTGLGLHISYNIVVNKHRGDIRFSSKPGRTKFEVWLPITAESQES